IGALHEVMGYRLTPDTRPRNEYPTIGPPRSDRGKTTDVMPPVIGSRHAAPSSPASPGTPDRREPLLAHALALVPDARIGNDTATMLDRLLRIVGVDPVEVNCKNRPILPDVLMRTRFVLISNELPDLRDASNAITTRYHILRTTKTMPEHQRDPDLF